MAPSKDIRLPSEIIIPLIEGQPFPGIIINRNGNILAANKPARSFFSMQSDDLTLFELFDAEDREKITRIIESALKFNGETVEYAEVSLQGKKVSLELSINAVKDETGSKYLFVKVNLPFQGGTANRGKAGFGLTISSEDLSGLIRNKKIVSVIESVKSSFPFTFLGKSKIQNEINKLAELFWIKDSNNNFLLVNNRFSSLLGLKSAQLEGRSERNFLPQYYLDLYKTIDQYVKETLSYFILEGIPLKGFASLKNYQSIEFPLVDAENRVQAIIGIGQKRESGTEGSSESDESGNLQLFRHLPKPYCIIDEAGSVKTISSSFESLFSVEESFITGRQYSDVFPEQLSHAIRGFLSAGRQSQEINLSLTQQNGEQTQFHVTLTKVINEVSASFRIIVGIERSADFDNLEELLKSRGKMYDILIQSNPEPIYVYSTENLRFIEANPSALELYGYTRDEFLQMDLTDLYTPEDIQSLLESGQGSAPVNRFNGPYKHRRKDGETLHIELCKTTFLFEGKEAHFNVVRDVSEKLTIEKKFTAFRNVVENTSDIIIVTDNVGFIREVNASVMENLGYRPAELIESSFISLASDEHRGLINTSVFYSQTAVSGRISVDLKKKDGSVIPANIAFIPVEGENNQIESFNLIVSTKQSGGETVREVEKVVIKEVVKEVEKIVPGPAGTDVLTRKGGLDPAQIGTIFHEILTPINVILGFVQEIKESLGAPNSEQQEAMDYISQNRDNLLDTMNTIAEYAKLNLVPEESISELRATLLLEEVAEELESLTDSLKKSLVFSKVSASLSFEGYPSLYKSFIVSLVKICFKISVEEQIYISAQAVDNNRFVISLKDNIGKVSSELLNNLVNLFNQNDISFVRSFNVSRYAALAVKKLVSMLGGKVEILGKGGKPFEVGIIFPYKAEPILPETAEAEVRPEEPVLSEEHEEENEPLTVLQSPMSEPAIQTPFAERQMTAGFERQTPEVPYTPSHIPPVVQNQPPPPPRSTQMAPPVHAPVTPVSHPGMTPVVSASHQEPVQQILELSSLSCLYIEDQVDSQILFKVQMKELGKMEFAVSFEDALPIITSQKFDFIVMDINLQGEYNGLDALKMIHKMPGFETLPIIAVTAYVLPGDREKFIAAGFNDFISKPIFREKMIEAMEKIFRKKIV